jgi:hypothetical protein
LGEAALAIGCAKSTICKALKYQQEKAVTRLVKKRYAISYFNEAGSCSPEGKELHIKRENPNAIRVEVVDTLKEGPGDTTVYRSINQAAQAIGCVHSAIIKALNFQEDSQRLIYKRYKVKHISD